MALGADAERKVEDYRMRESIYMAGLVSQELETNQLKGITSEVLGAYGDASRAALRGSLADSTANMEVLMLRQQARAKEQKLTQLKEDLEANRFDQSGPAGKALMQKCKALLTENRELGEMIREERLAELRAALQSEQRQNAELLTKCSEAADFCKELSQENDKLQGTISKVAGRLRQARNELEQIRRDKAEAKAKRKQEKHLKAQAQAAAALTAAQLQEAGASDNPANGADIPAEAPIAVEVLDDDEEPATLAAVAETSEAPPQAVAESPAQESLREKKKEKKDKGRDREGGERKLKKRKGEQKPGEE
eukprot:TRINITY_DN66291_c0_g1_i1.p1 TRINITY_DN66291_c0_g1~~TRINITY_DN66291_c0_g1_i1.p1  ORF type:complete len:343 (-),score=115.64 TRINITY_DN66291_c0_g1_i1:92-1018(-)